MRIVFHLGAHCTDEERLLRCLLKNRQVLAEQGIIVPGPARYRALLRDTAIALKGQIASHDTQDMVLEQIMDEDTAERLILSWDNFLSFPQWVLTDRLYPAAAERARAFARIFPEGAPEFFMAIRNPATFLPDLFAKQRDKTYEAFMGGTSPLDHHWSQVIADMAAANPDIPFTIWSDEDTPLIWPEVLTAITGIVPGTVLEDTDELLSTIMSPEGLSRMNTYLSGHTGQSVEQRRRVVSAFLDKFALPEKVEADIALPGWTVDLVEKLTANYHTDIARIKAMPGVRFLSA